MTGENGDKTKFVVWTGLLRHDSSNPHIECINLHDELSSGVGLNQNRRGDEELFKPGECLIQEKGMWGEVSLVRGAAMRI